MILQGSKQYPVREAILHCAAIKTDQFKGMRAFQVWAAINRWHLERKPPFKNGFGYHGLFMPDGQYYSGRPYKMIGAHCANHNAGTLGFLLIESKQIKGIGQFGDYFTDAQRESLRGHLSTIDGLVKVSGHNDYASKFCPGFKVQSQDWL